MFDGKLKDFRFEGGIVKTEDEKRQMAEKHRFKKEREFKQRLTEQEENEGADIRSFKFHSLERKEQGAKRGERREERGERRDSRKPRKSGFSGKSEFSGKPGRSDRKFNKPGRDFGKKNRRFNDEED